KNYPDKTRAKSMFAQGEARMRDLKSLPINDETAPFRFEDAYEAVREVLQAFMFSEGYNPYSHDAVIVFGYEKGLLTEAEFRRWDRNRKIRNDINYRSEKTTIEETKEAIEKASELMEKLRKKFEHLL
ncbi:MAG TPA: HEPN domain-containing protein, partial [archaeon]|nr:HEPN domain-containing protein [archaeon]